MPAPSIRINGGSPGVKAAIAATTSFSATLDDASGVRTVEWWIASTDETSETSDYTLTPSGSVGQTVTTTSLGLGTAALLHVRINGGIDAQTGNPSPETTEASCKFGVLLSNGLWVGCAGEEMEHDSTYGATEILNSGARSTASGVIGAPATLTLDDAVQNDVSTVLTLRHTYNAGSGANGIGARLAFSAEDAAGNNEDAGFITGRLSTATNGAEVSEIGLWTRTGGGAAVKNAYLSGAGLLTVTGGLSTTTVAASGNITGGNLKTDGVVTRSSSGALAIGDATATDIVFNAAAPTFTVKKSGTTNWSAGPSGGYLQVANSNEAGINFGINFSVTGEFRAEASGVLTLRANGGDAVVNLSGTTKLTVSTSSSTFTTRLNALRFVAAPSAPTSSTGSVTFDLSASQNITHTTTEATAVTVANGVTGQAGKLVFTQGGVGYAVTMPPNGTGVEYTDTITTIISGAGGATNTIVDSTANRRTIFHYYVLPNGKALIHGREVQSFIP